MTERARRVNPGLRSLPRLVRRLAFAIVAAIAVVAADPARAADADVTITDLSVARSVGRTTLTIRASAPPRFEAFAVDAPPRIVLDFAGTHFQVTGVPEPEGILAAMRFGPVSDGRGRMVLELAEPALIAHESRSGSASRPAELVLTLEPVDPAAFARSAAGGTAAAGRRVATLSNKVVVIDPGHGGVDPGAVTEDGLREKDLTLAFSKRLAAMLGETPGVDAKLTREDDRFLSLNRRIRIARAFGADLFVSIHADAAPQDYVQGATVYTLSERPSDAQAAALAARENLADSLSDAVEPAATEEVSSILADLLRRETKQHAATFAQTLVESMGKAVTMNNNPRRSARFRVLMAPDIPSILLELGYLTNESDIEALHKDAWQERAARSIAEAIETHFAQVGGGAAAQAAQ